MDMMAIRRRVLMGAKKVLDTTPIIEIYGKQQGAGNPIRFPPIDDNNSGIIIFYDYEPVKYHRTMVYYGTSAVMSMYRSDHSYMDYRRVEATAAPAETFGLKAHSVAVKVDIYLPLIDDCFFYIKETGEILFAGKNSPYYGYTNINDMPT